MGYRNYIAVVDKESLHKISNLSYDEIMEKYGDEGYISEYTFEDKGIEIKRILEIGEIVSYKEKGFKYFGRLVLFQYFQYKGNGKILC